MSAARPRFDLVIVGGGIAGLSAAHAAIEAGKSVALLESEGHFGGKMTTDREAGFQFEWGPHSFRHTATRLWELIDRCHLRSRVIRARRPGYRYIYRGGRLRRMPTGPLDLLRQDWLSHGGKLRVAAEPLVRARPDPSETLGDFARRRFGREWTEALLAPFVSGIYAGDIEELGAADAFPSLHAAELTHGSVLRGLLGNRQQHRPSTAPGAGVYSFDTGMGGLASAIAAALPLGTAHAGHRVTSIARHKDGFIVRASAATKSSGRAASQAFRCNRVLMATPLPLTLALLDKTCPSARAVAPPATTVPIALVQLGGPDPQRRAPRGFGCLVCRGEGIDALGILFPSSTFFGRGGASWLHAVFLGGAQHPELLDRDDEQLVQVARRSHRQALAGLGANHLAHRFAKVLRHPTGIPQYRPGHRAAVETFRGQLRAELPGLFVCGAHYDGISVGEAAQSGVDAVADALRWESP